MLEKAGARIGTSNAGILSEIYYGDIWQSYRGGESGFQSLDVMRLPAIAEYSLSSGMSVRWKPDAPLLRF